MVMSIVNWANFNLSNCQINVTESLFDKVKDKWAPSHLPIFELVPQAFDEQINRVYASIGHPAISSRNFWEIYDLMLTSFQSLPEDAHVSRAIQMADNGLEEQVALTENLRDLRYGDNGVGDLGYIYYGGLTDPLPASSSLRTPISSEEECEEVEEDLREFADFTDHESEDEDI